MNEQPVVVQKVSWWDLCPWTIIFKTLPVATGMAALALALLGTVATPMGWLASEKLFVNQEMLEDLVVMDIVQANRHPWRSLFPSFEEDPRAIPVFGVRLSGPRLVFEQLARPFQYLFSTKLSFREFLYFLVGCSWTVAVWSFVGVAISRVCVLHLARNEPVPLDDAFEFAMDKFTTAAGAIGIPLLAVGALCIPGFLLGLLMGFDIGAAIVSILWLVALAIGGVMTLLLLGLLFGWPLMVASVAAEGQNSFDALTRSYAYTFQRPVQYAFYMLVAVVFGGFCWLFVMQLATAVTQMAWWATSWGANVADAGRLDNLQGLANNVDADGNALGRSGAFSFAMFMIQFWNQALMTLAASFMYALFWCLASAVYLLLRKDVDETEMDEVYQVDEKRTYELPPLKSDENGIPQIQTPIPAGSQPVSDDEDDSDS